MHSNEEETYEVIFSYLKRNPNLSFVAVCGSEIVGAVMCGNDGRRGYLNHLGVSSEYRRKGIATQFLNRVEKALKDKDTPILAKVFGGLTVIYALSPIDLIPDFIPVLGYLDDLILLPVLVALTIKFIPADIMERNRKQACGLWENGKPKKWYYAIPSVLFWIIIIVVILKAIL